MNWWTERPFTNAAWFWPALFAASAAEASRVAVRMMTLDPDGDDSAPQEPPGITPSRTVLDLKTVRLRDYGASPGSAPRRAALIVAPLALHGAVVADLASGHSLVAALREAGIGRLFLADWRTAAPDMMHLGIDDYLATLNVLIDHIGGEVDLIGLCQGGWLALVYAARFPHKARRLVIAGAPIDPSAQASDLSQLAIATPSSVFEGFVAAGEGRVIGRTVSGFWGADRLDTSDARRALQLDADELPLAFPALRAAFDRWNAWTLDLPGTYYLEVIEKLYKHNELAGGRFVALGERIDLSRLRLPIYCLAGADDHVVAPQQVLALQRLVATAPEQIRCVTVPGTHLGLFMGRTTLGEHWPHVVRWLKDDTVPSMSAAAS